MAVVNSKFSALPQSSSIPTLAENEFIHLRETVQTFFTFVIHFLGRTIRNLKNSISRDFRDSQDLLKKLTRTLFPVLLEPALAEVPSVNMNSYFRKGFNDNIHKMSGPSGDGSQNIEEALPTLQSLLTEGHPLRPGFRLVFPDIDEVDPANFNDFLNEFGARSNLNYRELKSIYFETQGQILYEPGHPMEDADFAILEGYLGGIGIDEKDLAGVLMLIEKARRRINFSNSLDKMKVPLWMNKFSIFINPSSHTLDVMIPSAAIKHLLLRENRPLLEEYLNGQVWHELGHIAVANDLVVLKSGISEVAAPLKLLDLIGRKNLKIGKVEILTDIITRTLSGDKPYIDYSEYTIKRDELDRLKGLNSGNRAEKLLFYLMSYTVLQVRLKIAGAREDLPTLKWLERKINKLGEEARISVDDQQLLHDYYTQIAQSYTVKDGVILPQKPESGTFLGTLTVWIGILGMIGLGVGLEAIGAHGKEMVSEAENILSLPVTLLIANFFGFWGGHEKEVAIQTSNILAMPFPMLGLMSSFTHFQSQKFAKKIVAIGLLAGIVQLVLPVPFWVSIPLLIVGSILKEYIGNVLTHPHPSPLPEGEGIRGGSFFGGEGIGEVIVKVASALGETPEKIKEILSQRNISYSYVVNSILEHWTKKVEGPEICVIDFERAKTEEGRLLQLRALQQVEEYKRKNPSRKIVSFIINKNNLSVRDIEKLLGISNVLSVLKNPNEVVDELKRFNQINGTFSLRIITTHQGFRIWSNLLGNNAETWNLKFLIPQVIDVGKEVSISLVELGHISPAIKNWAENLSSEAAIEIEGEKLTIHGVPLDPPSPEESQKLTQLFHQQA